MIVTKRLWIMIVGFLCSFAFCQKSFSEGVLILKTKDKFLDEVVNGIHDEVEFSLKAQVAEIDEKLPLDTIKKSINQVDPKLVVLLGNTVIRHYIEFQKNNPAEHARPVLLLAALYIDQLVPQLKNATGIRYEVPAVTSAVNLRDVYSKNITKIGVIHREWLSEFVTMNVEFCRAEGIELLPVSLPNKSRKFDRLIARNLKALSSKVDAFWIVNDNALLTGDLLISSWIPRLEKASKPVIVGVEALVETPLSFGTLSVSPDYYALGIQAGGKIIDIQDQGWEVGDMDVDQPYSVTKVLNLAISKKRKLEIDKEKLGDVDRVIK